MINWLFETHVEPIYMWAQPTKVGLSIQKHTRAEDAKSSALPVFLLFPPRRLFLVLNPRVKQFIF